MLCRQSDRADLSDFLMEEYQFDLDTTLEENRLTLWRRMEKIYAIPETFLAHFNFLPFQAVGLLLGEVQREWIRTFT